MDKKQMKETAKSVFERYTDKEKVFVTSDGQAFFDESNAKNHAAKNRTGKELVMESFLRSEFEGAKTAKPKSAADPTGNVSEQKTAKVLIAEVSEMTIIEEVQAVLEIEKNGENRTTVVAACEKRIGELNTLKA